MSNNSNNLKSLYKLENIVIIGNGGRENSLAWAIQKNQFVKNIFLIPGNGGSETINKCRSININSSDVKKLINKLVSINADLVVIGPETPLANGLADELRAKNFIVFGPGADGAKLESSKSWAKNFMKEANIPTANFWKAETFDNAKKIINTATKPLVVKADGLASGKGVFIPENKEEALKAAKDILNGRFGNAGKTLVLEEKIAGPEVSVFAICDGQKFVLLPTAQDHKRLQENDEGLNTGGMGAYSPTPIIKEDMILQIKNEIIQPTINELKKRNIDYRGVLYFGLMITKSGPKVIEYNCRFGDPECQTIMPLMDENFLILLKKCAMGNLNGNEFIKSSNKVSGCVIATSRGYPLDYETGFPITFGDVDSDDFQVFHSGTKFNDSGHLVTEGGRVLSIVCQGQNFDEVFEKVYKNLKMIKYNGIFYRKDIGHQVRQKMDLN